MTSKRGGHRYLPLSLRTKFTQGRTIKAKNNCNQAQVAPCIHEFLMAILNIEQPAT